MTEFCMALTNPCGDVKGRIPGHVGFPLPGVSTSLLNPETGNLFSDMDLEGELLVQSP